MSFLLCCVHSYVDIFIHDISLYILNYFGIFDAKNEKTTTEYERFTTEVNVKFVWITNNCRGSKCEQHTFLSF